MMDPYWASALCKPVNRPEQTCEELFFFLEVNISGTKLFCINVNYIEFSEMSRMRSPLFVRGGP